MLVRLLPNTRRILSSSTLSNGLINIGINHLNNQQLRLRSSLPINVGILFVPQQEAWIVERMGKFHCILNPGINFLIPVVDAVKYVQSLKEIVIDIPQQSAITKDNVTLNIDGVLYLKIFDPYLASYGVEDAEYAISQLAQTTMRSEIGKIALDSVFRERESLNIGIVESINKAANSWGITCLRYEIRDVKLPSKVQEAMQMQVEAERRKRAAILESEGYREAAINKAEGEKRSKILVSEANKLEQINQAEGQAEALKRVALARAESVRMIADSLRNMHGNEAANLIIAQQYIQEFGKLAKTNNTILLSNDVSDVNKMVTQAFSIYKTLDRSNLNNIPNNYNSNNNNVVEEIKENSNENHK